MATITSIKCVLTQEHLDSVCIKYFVPEEVHPQLPGPDNTMHERPSGKVGMYTRFFDYANYRIPFSNFFVSVLVHFRIPFSQLSVFGSAKVSHFEILCRVCNIEPSVSLFRYFYTHNYKNGWFGFTKRPNVRACYSKNLDSVKNWNDHFFWVDEFVVPANARFSWFSGSNIVKDRAPAPSEYNVEHVNTLIAQASPFLRFPEEFLCWVGISRNYLLNKDTYPRFEYENGEEMDLNAFIRTADPRKVRIVERARAENERPIVTVAKHRTVTLLPTSVVRSSGELSASVEREFVGDASVGDGGDQGFDSVGGQDNVEPTVPVTEHVETEIPGPKRSKKKRVTRGSEKMPAASHPPKRLRADYGTTGGSATGGPSARIVALSDSSHHSGAKSADPEVDSLFRSAAPVMTEATTVTTVATTVAIPADVSKDKSAPHPSIFGSSSSSEKTDHTLSLFTGRSGSGFAAGSIRAEEVIGAGLEEIYVPEWTVTKGFELNDGHSCCHWPDMEGLVFYRAGGKSPGVLNKLLQNSRLSGEDHTDSNDMVPSLLLWAGILQVAIPADVGKDKSVSHLSVFGASSSSKKTDRTLSLFTGRSGSGFAAGSIRAEEVTDAGLEEIYVPEWTKSLAEEKDCLLGAKDKEIEELRSQLLKAKEESVEVAQLRARVSSLEATEGSLRGEVVSAKEHNGFLEQECGSLKLKVTSLESIIAEKDHELSDLGASSSSLRSQNQSLVNHVHELETSSTDLREKLEMYEGSMKWLKEFQDSLMRPLKTWLAEIDADFTRWLLTHGMKLLMAKCLNSTEYMEALGQAFGRAIKKGMQEGLAAGIEHGQAGRCLNDLEAYIPFAEVDFNSTVRDLRDLDFPLLRELSNKKDASTWDVIDLLHLDDVDRVVIGSQALSIALDICRGRVEKMERNLFERLPFLKDLFVSLDGPLSVEALIEPPVEVPVTNVLSTVVIVPHSGPSVSVEDYENPD
ncbi:hypothetical protein Tco_0517784, partial [Tanacetum coccineum]